MTENIYTSKIRKLIWNAVRTHFKLTNQMTLATSLKYEPNKSIGQTIAIGLSNQYGLSRTEVEKLLCIEPSSYDNKLKVFLDTIRNHEKDDDSKNFWHRYRMCDRYVKRRIEYFVVIS